MDILTNKDARDIGSSSTPKRGAVNLRDENVGPVAGHRPTTPSAKRVAAIVATELLNEADVSRILKTPKGTLRRWRCAGEGPVFHKMGAGPKSGVRYHPLDIEKYLDACRRFPITRAGSTGEGKQWR